MSALSRVAAGVPSIVRAPLSTSRARRRRNALLQRLPPGGVGAEIGVWKGDFSAQLLAATRPVALHLIDPWAYEDSEAYEESKYGGDRGEVTSQADMDRMYETVRGRFERQIAENLVHIHRQPSALAAGSFSAGFFDWVYIDGNHLYDYVRQDIALYTARVKPGGLITGDDYVEGEWWQGGVKRAVDEAIASGAYEMAAQPGTQFVLRHLGA